MVKDLTQSIRWRMTRVEAILRAHYRKCKHLHYKPNYSYSAGVNLYSDKSLSEYIGNNNVR